MAQFLLYLHLMLELSINLLFTQLVLLEQKNDHARSSLMSNSSPVDSVSFTDKLTMFIHIRSFDFTECETGSVRYHYGVIEKIKGFCQARNVLVHGHSMLEIFGLDGKSKKITKGLRILSIDYVNKQIRLFREIMWSVSFFVDHLSVTSLTQDGKDKIIKNILNSNFVEEIKAA